MRDRLEELQQRAQDFSEAAGESANPFSAEGDDDESVTVIRPQAVVFEEEPIIENFLTEAQHIRDDIAVLDIEVVCFWMFLEEVFFGHPFSKLFFFLYSVEEEKEKIGKCS